MIPAVGVDTTTKRRCTSGDAVLAQRIKILRLALCMTQEKAAEAIGVSHQQYQRYENGRHRLCALYLARIARTLQTTPNDLLEGL